MWGPESEAHCRVDTNSLVVLSPRGVFRTSSLLRRRVLLFRRMRACGVLMHVIAWRPSRSFGACRPPPSAPVRTCTSRSGFPSCGHPFVRSSCWLCAGRRRRFWIDNRTDDGDPSARRVTHTKSLLVVVDETIPVLFCFQ